MPITACDVASSFGWARLIVGEVTAAAVLGFLREAVRPTYRAAGWRLRSHRMFDPLRNRRRFAE